MVRRASTLAVGPRLCPAGARPCRARGGRGRRADQRRPRGARDHRAALPGPVRCRRRFGDPARSLRRLRRRRPRRVVPRASRSPRSPSRPARPDRGLRATHPVAMGHGPGRAGRVPCRHGAGGPLLPRRDTAGPDAAGRRSPGVRAGHHPGDASAARPTWADGRHSGAPHRVGDAPSVGAGPIPRGTACAGVDRAAAADVVHPLGRADGWDPPADLPRVRVPAPSRDDPHPLRGGRRRRAPPATIPSRPGGTTSSRRNRSST